MGLSGMFSMQERKPILYSEDIRISGGSGWSHIMRLSLVVTRRAMR